MNKATQRPNPQPILVWVKKDVYTRFDRQQWLEWEMRRPPEV